MEKRPERFRVILLILIAALIGYYFGVNKVTLDWKNYKPQLAVVNKEPPATVSNVDFSQFWTVWTKLENSYYDKTKLDPSKMVTGAIAGLVQSLDDPYTVYLPPKQNDNFKEALAGQFQGIGAELGMNNRQIIVVAPLAGSPAQKAGIKPADAILQVDGKSTAGWSLSQAVDNIRGPKGTVVTLTILHKDDGKPVDIKITRDTITVKSVDGYIKKIKDIPAVKTEGVLGDHKEDSVVYIRLSQFGDDTNKDWLTLVNKLSLQAKQDANFKGIILDLRNNPGGYLTDATFIASEFLKEGTPVVIQDNGIDKQTLSASRKGLFTDTPLVVLINKGSASASEIVSGALQDYGRAKLVGDTSFGKGTIQQAEDLGNGAGLHITIAKWLTPKSRWIHTSGLTPDVKVVLDQKDQSHDNQLEKAIEELVK